MYNMYTDMCNIKQNVICTEQMVETHLIFFYWSNNTNEITYEMNMTDPTLCPFAEHTKENSGN